MLTLGIILGLLSAAAASLAYLYSRRYAVRAVPETQAGPPWIPSLRLLVTAHLWLGGVCLVVLPLLLAATGLRPDQPGHAAMTSAGVALFYLLGNVLLFLTLRLTDASRVAPLLGLKVVLLALAVALFTGDHLTPGQWLAVMMAAGAAVILGASGGRLPIKTVLMICVTCVCFALSDLCIRLMIPAWLPHGAADAPQPQRITAAIAGMCLAYSGCGFAVAGLLPVVLRGQAQGAGDRRKALTRAMRGGLPYAAAWFFSMICLFSCFALVGVVFGGILQSTRGLISILIGAGVAYLGHHDLEQHAPWPVVARRLVAAGVMLGAIALYSAEASRINKTSDRRADRAGLLVVTPAQ